MKKFPNMLFWFCMGSLLITLAPFAWGPRDWFLIIGIAVLLLLLMVIILESLSFLRARSLRKMGLFPPLERATLEDVTKLLQAGEKVPAIKLYRSLHRASLPDAVQAIDKMQITPESPLI